MNADLLRDYQVDLAEKGANILREYGIVYFVMEPRTGKTWTSMACVEWFLDKKGYKVLFITKKKALPDIEAQYKRLAPKRYSLDVVNYESLHKVNKEYDLFILDEAHNLSQFPRPSEKTKLLQEMIGHRPIVLLSGTPTPECFTQLYFQFWVSKRSPFKNWPRFYDWAKEFVDVRKKMINGLMINDYTRADKDKIDKHTQHLFLSYTQEQAGFAELVEEEVLTVKMKDNTYKFANRLKKDKIVTNREGESVIADTPVRLMQLLHQIYSGTVIIGREQERRAAIVDHTKGEFIKQYFAGKRIAIFYKFIAEGTMLKWEFAGRYTESPEEFQAGLQDVFIGQIQSSREAINLSTADALVMLNIDFSAMSYWQSRARLQTKDRSNAAKVYWIFSENGIEHEIYKVVQKKKDFTIKHFKAHVEHS